MLIRTPILYGLLLAFYFPIIESKRRSKDGLRRRNKNWIQKVNICNSCSAVDRACVREVRVPCRLTSGRRSNRGGERADNSDRRKSRNKRQVRFEEDKYTSDGRCIQKESFLCRYFKCFDACCTGWSRDPKTQTCTIKTNSPVNITCQNGGTITTTVDGPVCVCKPFYTGRNCETVLCSHQCKNGGLCDLIDGIARCVCQDGFDGERCETPICDGGCQNGGRCISDENWSRPYCQCEFGYSGQSCEKGNYHPKPGSCPTISSTMLVNAGVCTTSCVDDNDCNGGHKCCSLGCGSSCMIPTTDYCIWNHTEYGIGDSFLPTPCLVCTCYNPNESQKFGGASCTPIPCPPLVPGCSAIKTGSCCDTCVDHIFLSKTSRYSDPKFINCPVTTLEIDLPVNSNTANLPINLRATDYLDNELEVRYSGRRFSVGDGDLTYHTVTASSAMDNMGKRAVCIFQIRLKDRQPPTFTSCPSDITSVRNIVTWTIPTATDNVGLVLQPYALSRKKPGDVFREGEHTVVYKTVDYEGNEANCIFLIRINKSAEERFDKLRASSIHIYSVSVGTFTGIVLIFILIIGVCFRSKRPRHGSVMVTEVDANSMVLTSQDRRPITAVDNIYSTHADLEPPPAYDNISKLADMKSNSKEGCTLMESEYVHHILPTITSSNMATTSFSCPSFSMSANGNSPCDVDTPSRFLYPPRKSNRLMYENTDTLKVKARNRSLK